MKNYGLIFKILELVLIVISVALLVWGFAVGFESKGNLPVEVLLKWAYIMVALALVSILIISLIIGIMNNPKVLVKYGLVLAGIAVLCLVSYLLAKGAPAVGLTTEQPDASTLKLTDTILNLTYITGAASILAIIFGEVVMAIRNK
jgi:hypothetical protein